MADIKKEILTGKTTEHLVQAGVFAGLMHEGVVEAFQDLQARSTEAGFQLSIMSGYRSFDRQLDIWNAKASGKRQILGDQDNPVDPVGLDDFQLVKAIMRFSALPGASRHHWGTDFDVYDEAAITDDYQIQLTLGETVEGGIFSELHRWLDAELPKTDFYRPYSVDTGGVSPEPWHLSYRPLSQLYSQDFTLKVLEDAWHGIELELRDTIEANLSELYNRFMRIE